jgi:tetratricopeptide (TPR) repeat protein
MAYQIWGKIIAIKLFKFMTIAIITSAAISCTQMPVYKKSTETKAPIFENLGTHTYKITTDSEESQMYFNQGLNLAYGFNHAEAGRSFKQATISDLDCAMCYWGAAYVLGPNINLPMSDKSVTEAYSLTQRALKSSTNATQKEKDIIKALSVRYASNPVEDRKPFDLNYASEMRQLSNKYPDDAEVLSLFAESLMDLHPWDYWRSDGNAHLWTSEILDTLEKALKINGNHPLANHLYIHAIEASPNPEKGITNADRLGDLVPDAGHLVHMPAHIYIRVGRYSDASAANVKAIQSDYSYISQCHAQGVYPLAYMPHNIHFLWASATLEGNSRVAMQAAHDLAEATDKEMMKMKGYGTLQHFYITPLYAMIKFGKWDEILKQPRPSENMLYPLGVWDFAMGMAYLRTKQMDSAKVHFNSLTKTVDNPKLTDIKIWDTNKTSDLLKIAMHLLAAEISEIEGDYNKALENLYIAMDIEDSLHYAEPHDWFSPVRLTLGDVLLKVGIAKEAEKIYLEDLKRYPENGWALYGLYRSLEAQGKYTDANTVKAKFNTAWSNADIKLTASRF